MKLTGISGEGGEEALDLLRGQDGVWGGLDLREGEPGAVDGMPVILDDRRVKEHRVLDSFGREAARDHAVDFRLDLRLRDGVDVLIHERLKVQALFLFVCGDSGRRDGGPAGIYIAVNGGRERERRLCLLVLEEAGTDGAGFGEAGVPRGLRHAGPFLSQLDMPGPGRELARGRDLDLRFLFFSLACDPLPAVCAED